MSPRAPSPVTRALLAGLALAVVAALALCLRAAILEDRARDIFLSLPERDLPQAQAAAEVRETIRLYREAEWANPDPTPLVRQGQAYLFLDQPARAQAMLERAVAREPDNALAWSLLSFAAGEADPPRGREARRRLAELVAPIEGARPRGVPGAAGPQDGDRP